MVLPARTAYKRKMKGVHGRDIIQKEAECFLSDTQLIEEAKRFVFQKKSENISRAPLERTRLISTAITVAVKCGNGSHVAVALPTPKCKSSTLC